MPGETQPTQDSIDLTINAMADDRSPSTAVPNSSCSGACCGGPSCNSAPNPEPE